MLRLTDNETGEHTYVEIPNTLDHLRLAQLVYDGIKGAYQLGKALKGPGGEALELLEEMPWEDG